jgi:hypothetical protein
MIKSNLMPPVSKTALRSAKDKNKAGKKKAGKKKGKSFYLLLFLLIAGIVYYNFRGIPKPLLEIIPQQVAVFLGLIKEEPTIAKSKEPREVAVPKLIAKGFRVEEPTVPVNASVEDIVNTLRPDISYKGEYKRKSEIPAKAQQSLVIRSCTKYAFNIILNTFYDASPDGIGYLDLAYQAPNFYFARIIAMDTNIRSSYINNLKSKDVNLNVIDSVSYKNGNVEFSLQGSIQLPMDKQFEFTQASKVNSEILALRNLAAVNRVRLTGLENPIEEVDFGIYRMVVLKTTTEADYPSLLSFANALQNSDIAFGVQQFASRPLGVDKMQSALEFTMCATK